MKRETSRLKFSVMDMLQSYLSAIAAYFKQGLDFTRLRIFIFTYPHHNYYDNDYYRNDNKNTESHTCLKDITHNTT